MSVWELEQEANGWNIFPDHLVRQEGFGEHLSDLFDRYSNQSELAEPFVYSIDRELIDDYLSVIPVEMNISLISNRLHASYYHSDESLYQDIDHIQANCIIYNDSESQFSLNIPTVVDELRGIYEDTFNKIK